VHCLYEESDVSWWVLHLTLVEHCIHLWIIMWHRSCTKHHWCLIS
jgi:hypothetical protein